MAEQRPSHQNAWRRFIAFFLALSLSLGLVFLLTVFASRASSRGAEEALAPLKQQEIDLEIAKQGPGEAFAGDVVTYTVQITNHSGSPISGVVVTDTWVAAEPDGSPPAAAFNGNYWLSPPGFVEYFTYTQDTDGAARWELDDPLPAGFQGMIQFTMAVPTELQPLHDDYYRYVIGPSTLGNSVAIEGDGVSVNDPDQVVTAIQGPVFKLEKFPITEPGVGPRPGRLITYALRLDNLLRSDAVNATGIVIEEIVPSKLEFEDAWADVGGMALAYDASTRKITWTLPPTFALSPGEVITVSFSTRLSTTQDWNDRITNDDDDCWVNANELAVPVKCWEPETVDTLGVVDITYVTEPSPLPANESYQNRYITYTVYVFNPLSQTIASNLRITDVMPSTWDYIRMLDGPNPVWTSGDPTNKMAWHWPGVAIQPNGVISFTYLAHIDADTRLKPLLCRTSYYHTATVSADPFPMVYHYPAPTSPVQKASLAKIYIQEQIRTRKSVTPRKQVASDVVTYTAKLENVADRTVTDIVFTDTLPTYFRYESMVSGPQPTNTPTRTIVWEIGDLDPEQEYELVFRAIADGLWGTTYFNAIDGLSPETDFCLRYREAGMEVLSPIVYTKDAIPALESGQWVVQDEWYQYDVEYRNQSRFFDHTIDAFQDYLYDGFTAGGDNVYLVEAPEAGLEALLLKNQASSWSHLFSVDTPGEGSGTLWCDDLRYLEDNYNPNYNREIYQEKAAFDVHAKDYGWATNASKESPILFKPHVDLRQIVEPKKVGFGGKVDVTLTLHNNMRNYHGGVPQPVDNIDITYELPAGFVYLDEVGSTPTPALQPDGTLLWADVALASGEGQETHLRFQLQAPFEEKLVGVPGRAYAVPDDMSFCIPKSEAKYYVVKGVEVSKKPSTAQPAPLSIIEYDLELANKTTAPVYNVTLTDTLPAGFTFIEVLEGPSETTSHPLVWRNLHFEPAGDAEGRDKVNIRFKVQVSGLFGDYDNLARGVSPSTYVTYTNKYFDDVRVTVQPGVVLYKSVWPDEAKAGETVVYTVTVDNRWTQAIADVRIIDTLPAGFSYKTTLSGVPPKVTRPQVLWEVAELDVGEKAEFVFVAEIDDQATGGNRCNQVSAIAHEKGNPTAEVPIPDTGPTACVAVQAGFDMQISKSDGKVTVDEGDLLAYTITYTNDNAADVTLTDVVITDTFGPLPPYAVPSGLGGGWSQVPGTDTYTYLVGDVGPGESGSVQFRLQLANSIPAQVKVVSNTAEIGYEVGGNAVEIDPSNNRSTDFGILRGSDLIVADLQISPEQPAVGDPITFNATIRNQGKDDAAGQGGDTDPAFIVELYAKASDFTPSGPPIDVDDHLGGLLTATNPLVDLREPYSCFLKGLKAGAEKTCEFVIDDLDEPDDYDVYVQVDVNPPDIYWSDYGAIEEAIESNNIYSHGWIRVVSHDVYLPIVKRRH